MRTRPTAPASANQTSRGMREKCCTAKSPTRDQRVGRSHQPKRRLSGDPIPICADASGNLRQQPVEISLGNVVHNPLSKRPKTAGKRRFVTKITIIPEHPWRLRVSLRAATKEVPMRKLAIGILAAAGVALSVPASAQGVWIGAGPVGVGVGVGPGYGYYNGYDYGPRYRSYAYDDGYTYRRHCRIVRENVNGYVRKIRRCW